MQNNPKFWKFETLFQIELVLGPSSIIGGSNSNMQNNPKTWKYPILFWWQKLWKWIKMNIFVTTKLQTTLQLQ
jgi:hypothetical protein